MFEEDVEIAENRVRQLDQCGEEEEEDDDEKALELGGNGRGHDGEKGTAVRRNSSTDGGPRAADTPSSSNASTGRNGACGDRCVEP